MPLSRDGEALKRSKPVSEAEWKLSLAKLKVMQANLPYQTDLGAATADALQRHSRELDDGLVKYDPAALIKFNQHHAPGGSPQGGQFSSAGGSTSASAEVVKPIDFGPAAHGLPKDGVQPWDTKEELFSHAPQAKDQFEAWLDKGSGLVNQVGGERINRAPDDLSVSEWKKPGAMFFMAGLKSEARATEKTMGENDGKWNRLLDVVRGTIAVDKVSDVREMVGKMTASGMELARQPKDRLANAVQGGWRGDVLMNFKMKNGMVAELQVGLKSMFAAKFVGGGHGIYEEFRSLAAKYPGKSPHEFPPDVRREWHGLDQKSRAFYARYWDQTAKEGLLKMTQKESYVEADNNYYKMVDGLPVGVWHGKKWAVPSPEGVAKASTDGTPVELSDIERSE